MQERKFDGSYTEPKPLTYKNLEEAKKNISTGSTKRLLIFATKDSQGKPTKEARRAWRRYQRSNN